jgi:hypothetical protein
MLSQERTVAMLGFLGGMVVVGNNAGSLQGALTAGLLMVCRMSLRFLPLSSALTNLSR